MNAVSVTGGDMFESVKLSDIMKDKAKYGTSGLRAEETKLTDELIYAHTMAFIQHNKIEPGSVLAIAGDLRESSPRIMRASFAAAIDAGLIPVNLGFIPTPALAVYCLEKKVHGLMVTASHNPPEHNGQKGYTPKGEITKADEAGILGQYVKIPAGRFNPDGSFKAAPSEVPVTREAEELYKQRYLDSFHPGMLAGKRIGVYCHSCVGRDIMVDLYRQMGAEVVPLGWSDKIISIDTEAVPQWVKDQAAAWAREQHLDAIVSGDPDCDRGFMFDGQGTLVHPDRADICVAQFLKADWVVTPISCSAALERCGSFKGTERTIVGSTAVVAAMEKLQEEHWGDVVVGYERNGGFLLGNPVKIEGGGTLKELMTRDAVIVHLAVLGLSVAEQKSVAEVVAKLPPLFTESKNFEKGDPFVAGAIPGQLVEANAPHHPYWGDIETVLGSPIAQVVTIDGLQVIGQNGNYVMLRASKNNPKDFRLICQGPSPADASAMVHDIEERVAAWKPI